MYDAEVSQHTYQNTRGCNKGLQSAPGEEGCIHVNELG